MRAFRILLAAIILALLAVSLASGQGSGAAPVRVIELDGAVDPVSARFIESRISLI